jgi:hypothetical protein
VAHASAEDSLAAAAAGIGALEVDDARRVAALDGAASSMLSAAERADAADAELR